MYNARPNQLPKARKDQLIVKQLPDEVLVYDLERDKAHCLNHTAGLVWKYCDGKTSVSAIAKSLGNETQTVADDRIVWLALDQLEKFQLLEDAPIKPDYLAGMNRRELVRHIGIAALALPVILSIASPTPAQTASACACAPPNCRPLGCPCGNPGDCVNTANSCTGGICV